MPIYEYRCSGCGARLEVLVRSSSDLPSCPNCGALLTEKLFSVPYIASGQTAREAGKTCCGRQERCDTPPCSAGGTCRHER
jgi:putative FmdB family regulatory protein